MVARSKSLEFDMTIRPIRGSGKVIRPTILGSDMTAKPNKLWSIFVGSDISGGAT